MSLDCIHFLVSPVAQCKESACNAGAAGSILGSPRSPEGRHDNPSQYSCLENPMCRGACKAIVHRVIKSQTWLKWLNTYTQHPLVSSKEHSPTKKIRVLMEGACLIPVHEAWKEQASSGVCVCVCVCACVSYQKQESAQKVMGKRRMFLLGNSETIGESNN